MNTTAGFYKLDEILLYAPNYVFNAKYELHKESKDNHTYPIDGWSWFDSEELARAFFNLPQSRTVV